MSTRLLIALAIAALLAACGGGGDEPDQRKDDPLPNCAAQPDICR